MGHGSLKCQVTSHDFASVTFPELPFGAARDSKLHSPLCNIPYRLTVNLVLSD